VVGGLGEGDFSVFWMVLVCGWLGGGVYSGGDVRACGVVVVVVVMMMMMMLVVVFVDGVGGWVGGWKGGCFFVFCLWSDVGFSGGMARVVYCY
jgi:hypothetical protein